MTTQEIYDKHFGAGSFERLPGLDRLKMIDLICEATTNGINLMSNKLKS